MGLSYIHIFSTPLNIELLDARGASEGKKRCSFAAIKSTYRYIDVHPFILMYSKIMYEGHMTVDIAVFVSKLCSTDYTLVLAVHFALKRKLLDKKFVKKNYSSHCIILNY